MEPNKDLGQNIEASVWDGRWTGSLPGGLMDQMPFERIYSPRTLLGI